MSIILETKLLHAYVIKTLAKHSIERPKIKTRIPPRYDIPRELKNDVDINDIRSIEYSLEIPKLSYPLAEKALEEIKFWLGLRGYLYPIKKNYHHFYSLRKIKFYIFAKIKKENRYV